MGNRGNICMEEGDGKKIYFYGHWSGDGLFKILQSALKRGHSRWSDEQYLSRIIFCEMVKGDEQNLSGFGISTYVGDNEHPILVVNSSKQTVSIEEDTKKSWSFEDFVNLKKDPR